MVIVSYDVEFERKVRKIKNNADLIKVKKQIAKIVENPLVSKPMRFSRKGTREVYVAPFRLSYIFYEAEDNVVFLELYHKDEQ